MTKSKVVDGVDLHKVGGSNAIMIGWEKEPKRRLLVVYKNGTVYEFKDVERRHYVNLLEPAISVGRYMFKYIMPRYQSKKIATLPELIW